MTTNYFTNSLNYTRSFTEDEFISIFNNLNSTNIYFSNVLKALVYIRISLGQLLLVDLNDTINRQLLELYSIQYSVGNTFHLKFVHNDNALEYTFDDALISVGYSGAIPVSTLESRYFKQYTQYQHNQYLLTNNLVKATGVYAQQPS